jgi:hypothetical protein
MDLYANYILVGSRASLVAYRAFSKLSIKEATKK